MTTPPADKPKLCENCEHFRNGQCSCPIPVWVRLDDDYTGLVNKWTDAHLCDCYKPKEDKP